MTFSKNLYTFPSIARRKFSAGNPHILLRLSSRASRLFNEFGTQIIRHTDTQDSTEEGAFLFFTFRYFKTLSDAKFRLAFMENRIFKLPHYTGYDSMSFISGAWQSSSTLICKKVNLISWHRHCYSMSGLAVHKQKLTCCSLFDPIRLKVNASLFQWCISEMSAAWYFFQVYVSRALEDTLPACIRYLNSVSYLLYKDCGLGGDCSDWLTENTHQ